MPWPTYSERFHHHQAAGNWTWEVPAGMRAIITNVDAINLGQVPTFVAVYVGPICAVFLDFPAYLDRANLTMRVVAYQGEVVSLSLLASATHTTVDGYLMRDESGATGPPGETGYEKLLRPELLPAAADRAP